MDKEEFSDKFNIELNKQLNTFSSKVKSFFKKMDKIELTLFIIFISCMIIGLSLFGIAGSEIIKNKDCYQVSFNLTSIEYKNNDIIFKNNEFIITGIENNTNVSYQVLEKGIDVYELREMFPNGEYYLNMCPETNKLGEKKYILRGLIDVNRINKIFFGRN